MKCVDVLTSFVVSVVLMLFFFWYGIVLGHCQTAHMPISEILVHPLPVLLIIFQEVIKKKI